MALFLWLFNQQSRPAVTLAALVCQVYATFLAKLLLKPAHRVCTVAGDKTVDKYLASNG